MPLNEIIKQASPLPFDPVSTKRSAMVVKITPAMARYILEYHNEDNRKLCPSQVNKIGQSVDTFGWLFTGDAVVFNINGDINESQHRLTFIAGQDDGEYETVVVLGAEPDSFSNAAIAKPRRAHDEIYRKDNTALPSQTAILGDLLKRKGNKPRLTINNAVKQWYDWKDDIKKAENICNSFLSETEDFSTQTKTVGAWATLCVNAKLGDEAEAFLDLLKAELLGDSTCRLTTDFVAYWKEHMPDTGWFLIMEQQSRQNFLVYEKDNRVAIININPSKKGSTAVMAVGPRSGLN